jgi:hypothetical protein
LTTHDAIAKVLRLAAQREADERRQMVTDLIVTADGTPDDDYIEAALAWHAEAWSTARLDLAAQVRERLGSCSRPSSSIPRQ